MKFITDLSKGVLGAPDSSELWQEILGHIPDSVLLKPGVRILNIACGHGTEAVILAKRMIALGIPREQVNESFVLLDKYQVFTNYAKKVYGFKNVITQDFLEWSTDMKFDVVIGNPPYQAPKKGDYSFWARFVDKSNQLLAPKGYMSMVIPAGWMSPTNDIREGRKSVLRDIFSSENTFYINVDPNLGSKYFSGIGQKFTYFCLQKGRYQKTTINTGEELIDLDLSKVPMLTKDINSVAVNVIAKLSAVSEKWQFTRYIMSENWNEVEFVHSKTHQYARINGNTNHLEKIVYSQTPCKYQGIKKVVLPYNGTEYKFVVDSGKHGCTNAYVMTLDSGDKIKSARTYFESDLIKWLGKNKFTQYNEGALINSIGKMDLTRDISAADIYKFYKLTKQEIDYVESQIH